MKNMRSKFVGGVFAALAAFGMIASAPTPAVAQEEEEQSRGSQTLDPRVARVLQTVFELMQAEDYQTALAELNQLIAQRGSSMKPFDRATTYELRGSVKASLEDFRGALNDFQTALNTRALPANRNNQLQYFIAQLYFQVEDYSSAISGLNTWIRTAQQLGESVDPNAYYLLAAAYTQITPPNYSASRSPAENAVRVHEAQVAAPVPEGGQPIEPRKSYYDLLNLVYSELNQLTPRTALLEKMVNLWPGTKSYWTQLSGAYSQLGRDREAFAVIEVAYRAGLLDRESEFITLIQYYSFFENPYRGAKLLEKEMAAGNIDRDQDNLVLLSQLWSQSREHKKSIPILREAAQRSNDGDLYYRLGMVLLADEQYAASQRALENALNRGGLGDDTGDAWLLLGTARFSQAGPTDTDVWANAREAFVNAQRYTDSRTRATQWIGYIDAVQSTYEAQQALELKQNIDRCNDELDRIETQRRIRDLRNTPASQAELDQEAEILASCAEFIDTGAAAAQ
ncbi:MAG: hypothetical protein AAGC77_03105 [Pseudomonadota bacterium]